MVILEGYIMQGLEFLAQDYPGVVVGLDDNKRVVFVGGEKAAAVSGYLTAGEYLGVQNGRLLSNLSAFVDRVIEEDPLPAGHFESTCEEGVICWKGIFHEDSGLIILKGRMEVSAKSLVLNISDENENFLSTLLGNLPGMVYRCRNDVNWTMDFISHGCFELTGYEVDSLLDNSELSYSDIILPQYRAHVWECVQEAVHDREPFEMIYKIRTASGDEKWVWEKGVETTGDDGEGFLEGFITDVTPLMLAEQALHQSEDRYRLMAEKTGQLVYDLDIASGKLVWSGAVREITGYEESEFQSVDLQGWEDGIHLDDRNSVISELQDCLSKGRPFVSVYRFKRKDGSYLYVEDEGSFVLNASGRPVRMVGVLRDYSHKMKIQELMIQSEKMTTVASLSASMSHEINNPLGIIIQSAQNIERRISPDLPANIETAEKMGVPLESVRRYLRERKILTLVEEIKEAGGRAAKVIVNMLNFSRRSENKKDYCCIASIVDQVIELADKELCNGEGCDFRKIKFVLDIQDELPKVLCFAAELEQVLLNLINNSAQSMIDAGVSGKEPQIVIRCSSNSAYLNIEVEDNGPGMDAYARKRAFEPFFSSGGRGRSGLGLSVAYFIITRNHGGTIRIDSEPGRGTRFIIQIPRGSVPDIFSLEQV
ncbi:PAS domain-containing protein [Maridesulfovibrio sp.]|uniref:PAS domain-containing protein n=1 Tax=Maridesulfovibrio sp. TaxID=2795000 RepID=UPI0029F56D67|nr:PAS domain-containing protein [Maridesulfovibrio sp.]